MCSKEVKQQKKEESSVTSKPSVDVKNKRKHEENVFGQWGFLIYYILSKGGSVTIRPSIKKPVIDKRNQINIHCVEVGEHIFSEEGIQKQVDLMIKGSGEQKYVTRTRRKYVHDFLMNSILNWCKEESKKEKIQVSTKLSKKGKNINKSPNIVINSVTINGKTYDRHFIRTNCGDWLKKVLEYLFENVQAKDELVTISKTTIPPDTVIEGMNLESLQMNTKIPEIKKFKPSPTTKINGLAGHYDPCGRLVMWDCQLYLPFSIEDKLKPIDYFPP
ncbi:hypothetical protein EDI_289440 [Entamoeba dispar SAW760]|uniref:Uncharacterized protein n=1 Tax=Entamoeba dispar (strain ATCC PRA-260 / SAW760) TaxID=370354 RepID=B0EV98_ENTDS|nr:uncharacterized protein EDI_289440 [Entamoeba dispar SAW760]EDR21510.1 hypothetical protein EDI_289440 [Entamoeba dispar SAW760]|eukprot:EDR21510.1 hypothetical protein EDI_289440 [Entamoeba dispar SAW760]